MIHGNPTGELRLHAVEEAQPLPAAEPHALNGQPRDFGEKPAVADVYLYEDYRRFLKDRFEELQSRDATFSQRGLSRKAGIANPGFFNEVIKGRRRLSPAATEKMAKGLALAPSEAKYLALLVEYNETRDARAKQSLCQQMIFRRNRKFVERLASQSGDAPRNPAHAMVRAAIAACDFRGDFEKLSRFIWPAMPVQAVKKCVLELCEWGLVEQDANSVYRLPGGQALPWEADQETMEMHVHPPQGGHFTSDVIPVSERTWRRMMERLALTREEILEWVKQEPSPQPGRVAQLNLHLLPRSWESRAEA